MASSSETSCGRVIWLGGVTCKVVPKPEVLVMVRFIRAALTLFFVTLFAPLGHAEEARPKFPPDETLTLPSLVLTNEQ